MRPKEAFYICNPFLDPGDPIIEEERDWDIRVEEAEERIWDDYDEMLDALYLYWESDEAVAGLVSAVLEARAGDECAAGFELLSMAKKAVRLAAEKEVGK